MLARIYHKNLTFVSEKRITSFIKKLTYIILFPLVITIGISVNAMAQGSAASFPKAELSIKTSEALHNFQIELALDDSHREYGLMFRSELPEMSGMLFIYDEKRDISMWMKNTFISLDILFIDNEGKIMTIAESTQPRSLSLIRSGGAAKAVLELNGGLTKRLGIQVGDEIIYPIFENASK